MKDTDLVFTGDIFDKGIGITKPTIDRILGSDNAYDALALYTFYCYTVKWQETTSIRCTAAFVMKGCSVGRERLQRARATLKSLGLIADKAVKERGRVVSNYVEVRFVLSSEDLSDKNPTAQRISVCRKSRPTVSGDKCLVSNSKMLNEDNEMLNEQIGGDYWDEPDTFELAAEELGKEKQAKETKPKKAIVKFSAPLDSEFKRAIRQQFAGYKIDYQLQEAKMDAWILLNPPRKKSRKFYANWIARAAEQAPKERSM